MNTTLNLTPEQVYALLAALDEANLNTQQNEDLSQFTSRWAGIEEELTKQQDKWYH